MGQYYVHLSDLAFSEVSVGISTQKNENKMNSLISYIDYKGEVAKLLGALLKVPLVSAHIFYYIFFFVVVVSIVLLPFSCCSWYCFAEGKRRERSWSA